MIILGQRLASSRLGVAHISCKQNPLDRLPNEELEQLVQCLRASITGSGPSQQLGNVEILFPMIA